MSLYDQHLSIASLLEMSDHVREKPLLGRRESMMERLPSISENQPLLVADLCQDQRMISNRQSHSSVSDVPLALHHPSSIPPSACLSLPANITDLSVLLSQLKLNSGTSCHQLDQRSDIFSNPPKFNRSMSEPFHHRSLDSLPLSSKFTPDIFDLRTINNSNNSSSIGSSNNNNGCCRYKTELCRPFEENGSCKYGEKCQFAHGKHELRSLARHPKYKTDLCKTYHTTGLCPYGPRCHFIHNDEERQLNLINRLVLEHQRQQVVADQQNNKLLRQKQLLLATAISNQRPRTTAGSGQVPADASVEQLSALIDLHATISSLQSSRTNPQQSWQMPKTSLAAPSAYYQHQQHHHQQQQQVRHLSCGGSLNSSSDSPSSSITDSPSPSPTSLEEPLVAKNLPAILETLLKMNRTSVLN